MIKLSVSPGIFNSGKNFNLDKRDYLNVALPFSGNDNVVSNQNQKTSDVKKQNNQQPKELNGKRWTGRNVVDAFTVTAYAAIVMSAIAIKKCRPGVVKDVEKLAANKKAGRALKDGIELEGKVLQGKCDKGGPLYKLFDYFGKLKENSAELTNNLVYGFGTLVIMPLVILLSPFGKKDASKEDRTFTVLRQPISFATVFAVQLTFDKVFKSLINELNKYRLLDGIKTKKGEELFFSDDRMNEELQNILTKVNKDKTKNHFYFNEACLRDKENFAKELKILDLHLKGDKREFVVDGGDSRIPVSIKAKGNRFTLEEFSDSLVSIIKSIGDKKPTEKQINNLKKLVEHYGQSSPGLFKKLENMAYSGARGRGLKEMSVIIANSIISQALGIMMLNFVYGKMMKKYTQLKQNVVSNQDSVKGGSK